MKTLLTQTDYPREYLSLVALSWMQFSLEIFAEQKLLWLHIAQYELIKYFCQALAPNLSPQTQKSKTKGLRLTLKSYGPPPHPTLSRQTL